MSDLPTHDTETGEALSGAFLTARQRAHELSRSANRLRADGGAQEAVAAARVEARAAEDAAFEQMLADRERFHDAARAADLIKREKRAEALELEVLAERENATLQRILLVLRDRGPQTGGELEAMRLKGCSHNLLRPMLRRGVELGLIRRRQDGRRVLWSAVPVNALASAA